MSPPMALSPVPEPRPPLPAASEDPLHVSLAAAMERRSLSVSAVGSLLRAEGIAISRTRLHQLSPDRAPDQFPGFAPAIRR